jgi:DNA-binding NarL/FixJ family response regulator
MTQRAEVVALVPWTNSVIALRAGSKDAAVVTRSAFETATHVGNLDSFVTAYRAFPAILTSLLGQARSDTSLEETIEAAHDHALARRAGLRMPRTKHVGDALSRREQEILNLLVRGLLNKQIANTLYIAEGTVKTHLHNIYTKLGVRSRTEAVLLVTGNPSD